MSGLGLGLLVVVLLLATAFGLWRRRTDGRFSEPARPVSMTESRSVLTPDQLGQPLGEHATLVEFSSAFCAPCRATRTVLHRVADTVSGVTFVEIDAEASLDLTRELSILRTPTVLILDSTGTIRHRASGQPRYADVVGALGAIHPGLAEVSAPTLDSGGARP
ncbi:MAG: thioredoxin family protein [Actinomycetes bacterium]